MLNDDGHAIVTRGLVKTFGAHRAVDGVDLVVPTGTVYGLLGPNGAGKTTTVRMLATLLRPDAGTATVLGHDVIRHPRRVRERVSLTGQYASLDEELTARENLMLLGRLLGHTARAARRRGDALLETFALAEAADRQVVHFSGGMRRRLDIAASLVVTPDVLFLDEPTTGLDPRSRNQIWDVVREIVAQGTTVLLTTQYLEEADRLAARVAVVDHGRVIAEGTPGELKASLGAGSVHVRLTEPEQRAEAMRVLGEVLGVPVEAGADSGTLTARLRGGEASGDLARRAARALATLAESGVAVEDFALGRPSLDEVFLSLTDRTSEEVRS
ncbi:daunorubicin resistance protein DrrA family ABC transporter ATP-binding protein [Saccharomonospora piscinae]|uniref:Daunorubicin resistance protein DrrA family ABC transporter ATP-binding protein n=1 Tax=Saccharomonospora piscinae TaxID=687388 RepID=A0A1V9A973_SACPI|nr:daunorubicin resistance protein DrrA family ABC transporter ATP-binding protein [Saccharomonospora piscinae]OQO93633.1 daunorubicin resistance protein DrrA family ABC transporter ATP-binding protein [Saccharomonospora piscinae]TLW94793.1 daunorubicin resistance protein DrrA family ABC transporter ATP-binding protein [Saccharomonospora piscinae]